MMLFHRRVFNLILCLTMIAVLGGCASAAKKRKIAILRVHVEGRADASGDTQVVPILRTNSAMLTVQKRFFLTEGNVKRAAVLEVPGGYSLEVEFDKQGRWLLEQYTGAARGKHLAIFCCFGMKPGEEPANCRWLAAPRVTRQIKDGILRFTPDASREEAESIVDGLKNVARKVQDKEPEF